MSERTSPPMAFLSECSSMQAMPSPRSTSDAPGLVRMGACLRRKSATRAWPGMAGTEMVWPVTGWIAGVAVLRVPTGSAQRRSGRARVRRRADASAFMRFTVSMTPAASHISKGPSSQLKPARMAASMEGASSATSPMRSAAKFHSEERKGQRKAAALSLAGSFASRRRRRSGSVAAFFAISSDGRAGFAAGTVFERGEIENEALVFAIGAANLFVEALAGFVAEPAALEKFFENGGKSTACDTLRKVGGDVGEDVDADEIGEAEGAGARPADGGAGQRVDLFDGESLLEHQVGGVEHDRDADAVGDEVGRVVREDDLLAEEAISESGESGDDGGIGFGCGDDFQQTHVARRIEEVRAEEAAANGGNRGGDAGDGQAGSVGGEEGVRSEMRKHAGEERGFDFEIFGDGFDDPIAARRFWAGRRRRCRE